MYFDTETEAASRGFLVYSMYLATPCDRHCIPWFPSVSMYLATPCSLTRIWLHLVTDAASRGFLVLACRLATPCTLNCIWLHMSPTLHRVVS